MLKILIVKDAASQRDLTTLENRFQDQAKFRRADDLDTALDYLDRGDVSCILLDAALADVDGRDAYETLREKHPQVPLGLLVGEAGTTRLVNMDGGASFHVHYGASALEIFNQVASTLEKLGTPPSAPTRGRLGPDATTRPPRPPSIPVDIVEAIESPSTEPEQPTDDIPTRVRAAEDALAVTTRNLRFVTWVVALLVASAIIILLRS